MADEYKHIYKRFLKAGSHEDKMMRAAILFHFTDGKMKTQTIYLISTIYKISGKPRIPSEKSGFRDQTFYLYTNPSLQDGMSWRV